MLKAIGKALASGIAAIWKTTLSAADDILQLGLSPLRAVFGGSGGGAPVPSFTPDVEPGDLIKKLRIGPTKTADRRDQERDGVAVVTKYLQATPTQRTTMSLDTLSVDVRATLIGLDEHELYALRNAGPLAIRRFVAGKSHRVHGVPDVGGQPDSAPRKKSTVEAMQERIRERLGEHRSAPVHARVL